MNFLIPMSKKFTYLPIFYSYLLPFISSLSPIPTPFLGIDCKAAKGIYNIRSECSNLARCKCPMVKYSEEGLKQCVMILILLKLQDKWARKSS